MPSIQLGLWAKMSQESYPSKMPLEVSLQSWLAHPSRSSPDVKTDDGLTRVWLSDPKGRQLGGFWTASISGCHSEGGVSFCWPSPYPTLRSLLERRPIPRRYFLTTNASYRPLSSLKIEKAAIRLIFRAFLRLSSCHRPTQEVAALPLQILPLEQIRPGRQGMAIRHLAMQRRRAERVA